MLYKMLSWISDLEKLITNVKIIIPYVNSQSLSKLIIS